MRDNTGKLELRMRHVGPWPMNSYALICPTTREAVLIDPGADPGTLLEMLADSQPVGILVSHSHPDHIGALEAVRESLRVPVLAHRGPHFGGMSLKADRWVADGDQVQVGVHAVRVYHTPGHIDDLVCFALWGRDVGGDHRVIVGDAIFEGGPGKTWSSDGFQITLQTLRTIILDWPDETICYPGHGPDFRLGSVRPAVEAFLSKDHGAFFGDATWEM